MPQHSEKNILKMMFLLSRLLYVFFLLLLLLYFFGCVLKTQVHIFKQNGINVNILLYVLSFHIS